jgi:hypothetical protein
MSRPVILLLTFAVFFYTQVFRVCGDDSVDPQPDFKILLGKKIDGTMNFDCVVRLITPIAKTDNIFFIRYAVTSDAISYDIVWAEPSWEHLNFPYPPFGMSMYADKSQFLLYNTYNEVRWKKDIAHEHRGVFDSTCSNYPLEDAGFYYQSSLEQRLFLNDKRLFIESLQKRKNVLLERDTNVKRN